MSACSSAKVINLEPKVTETSNANSADADSKVQEKNQTTSVAVKELEKKSTAPEPVDEIQLLWAIPSVPVDSYIIYYGFSRERLDHQVKISLGQVETFEDPRFGTVHRYFLSNIPIDKTVYVSIAAMRGANVSKAGEVIELKPEKIK